MTNNEPIGQPIRSLQIMLRAIAQNDADVLPVVPDGIYSKDTAASVRSFQRKHGLPETGETDMDTWYGVAGEYRRAMIEISPAEPVYPILQPGQEIQAGEINEHLYMMHGMLRAIGAHHASMPLVSCNNIHDGTSVKGIRWLQIRAGLEASGTITRETWKHLSRLYRVTVGDGTLASSQMSRADSAKG